MSKICIDCGGGVNRNGLRCTECANLHKAKIADRRCIKGKKAKELKLKNGLRVLNNCFGQVMATADKVWFGSNG